MTLEQERRKQLAIDWAYFYIWNINNEGNPEYTLHRIAQLCGCTEATIGKYVRKIRSGKL